MKAIRVLLAALVGAALALPPAAAAQSPGSNPLSPGFPQQSVSVPTTSTTVAPTISTPTTAGSGSGFTGSSVVVVAVGALIVLGGISFFIWRDARRRAPARAAMAVGEGRRQGSKRPQKPRKLSPAERRRRKRGRAR